MATTDPHYTDGTQNDAAPQNWGPPPEAPHVEHLDQANPDALSLCVDPPTEAWLTFHNLTDGTSVTVLYAVAPGSPEAPPVKVELHGTPHVCVPVEIPCATTVSWDASWNIGTGRSAVGSYTTSECPAPPPVPAPEAPPAAPTPVELTTATVEQAPAPPAPELAATGPATLGLELALAVALLALGRQLAKLSPRRAAVRGDAS